MSDLYVKAVLTVIACALCVIALQNQFGIQSAIAQSGQPVGSSPQNPIYVATTSRDYCYENCRKENVLAMRQQ